jgi:hypothetical protein
MLEDFGEKLVVWVHLRAPPFRSARNFLVARALASALLWESGWNEKTGRS